MKLRKSPDGEKFMATVKVGPKGQIVIPKEVREMFGIDAGDSLVILADSKKGIAIQRSNVLSAIADAIFGGKVPTHGETEDEQKQFAQKIRDITADEEEE